MACLPILARGSKPDIVTLLITLVKVLGRTINLRGRAPPQCCQIRAVAPQAWETNERGQAIGMYEELF